MIVFAVGVEHALDVPVHGPHDANAREHRRPAGHPGGLFYHSRVTSGKSVIGSGILYDLHSRRAHFRAWE
jgi:hypothetical protein